MTIPAGWYPDPENLPSKRFWGGSDWTDQRLDTPPADPPPDPPAPQPDVGLDPDESASPPTSDPEHPPQRRIDTGADTGRLIRNYGLGVGIGLLLVIATTMWAAFSTPGRNEVVISGPSVTTTRSESANPAPPAVAQAPTRAPIPSHDDIVNAGMSFSIGTLELAPSVSSPDNDYLTAEAKGQFVILYLSIANISDETTHYLAAQQRLTADGVVYAPDQATSRLLGAISEELPPGASTQTALVFDIPAGAAPQTLELHGDSSSPGSVITFR